MHPNFVIISKNNHIWRGYEVEMSLNNQLNIYSKFILNLKVFIFFVFKSIQDL